MNLDDSQKKQVTQWIAEGLKLSEIQNRITSEFKLKLTYMDVRLLVDDLKLTPKDPEPPKSVEPSPKLEEADRADQATAPKPKEVSGQAAGKVSLSVDQLTRPGALVSGKVAFSDGVTAEWYLDQTGRLGIVPRQQGYRPPAGDVQEFQLALQNELAKLGL